MNDNNQAVDQNLVVKSSTGLTDAVFYNVKAQPFGLYGLYEPYSEGSFTRMPQSVSSTVNPGVEWGAHFTAGGRVRFSTDSPYIAIKAVIKSVSRFPHMPMTNSAGFDMYVDKGGDSRYVHTFVPPMDMTDGFESAYNFPESGTHSVTVNFPLYGTVDLLYIGIKENTSVFKEADYIPVKPILYYGSSITQGGCASRPGTSYQAIISRKFNIDYINLGFSGAARGEDTMTDYLAGIDASVFVCDYDYNAPDVDHLEKTHSRLYRRYRAVRPNVPIIFVSNPDYIDNDDNIRRREIIFRTYSEAYRGGDKDVYFIDGVNLFGTYGHDSCTVDGCHPNDLGFWRMADVIGETIGNILRKK
ncbi:hypothetical protein SDC9_89374 [bioreactor metagenome]|uniref:SGNH hydrolase-type esterase domain-containing protein n=1 Tax=bioreactor metagenome TaxID=1076179 RepID=A0A644ZP70_9ZZZZ|nr:SGNH/GDSL hydrolase family protein [Oscillospiraceae bacterium]